MLEKELFCFKNKKIIITGHTGFKGAWLSLWLKHLGADVYGISIDVPTNPSLYAVTGLGLQIQEIFLDICDQSRVVDVFQDIEPDFVFHLAGQPIVKWSYDDPLATIKTNAVGTANVLESIRKCKKSVIAVMITSDKVYENVEWPWGYRENDRIGGNDPYSASKSMAELVIKTYTQSFFQEESSGVKLGVARAGNVIGGGDWAFGRIVPDCVRAWSKGQAVSIRNPESTRPWQHVLEPLRGYLTLAIMLQNKPEIHGEPYNFGPFGNQTFTVDRLILEMAKYLKNMSANIEDHGNVAFKEAGLLKLNCDKALFDLCWSPCLNFEETVRLTAQWYEMYYSGQAMSMQDFTLSQIESYTAIINEQLRS